MSLVIATIYAGFATVVFLIRGSKPFTAIGGTLPVVLMTYYAAAVVVGVAVGLLMPLGKTLVGRVFISLLASTSVFFCIAVGSDGPFWQWSIDSWKAVGALGGIFSIVGLLAWNRIARASSSF